MNFQSEFCSLMLLGFWGNFLLWGEKKSLYKFKKKFYEMVK